MFCSSSCRRSTEIPASLQGKPFSQQALPQGLLRDPAVRGAAHLPNLAAGNTGSGRCDATLTPLARNAYFVGEAAAIAAAATTVTTTSAAATAATAAATGAATTATAAAAAAAAAATATATATAAATATTFAVAAVAAASTGFLACLVEIAAAAPLWHETSAAQLWRATPTKSYSRWGQQTQTTTCSTKKCLQGAILNA